MIREEDLAVLEAAAAVGEVLDEDYVVYSVELVIGETLLSVSCDGEEFSVRDNGHFKEWTGVLSDFKSELLEHHAWLNRPNRDPMKDAILSMRDRGFYDVSLYGSDEPQV